MLSCIQYQHQKLGPGILSPCRFFLYPFSSTSSFLCIFSILIITLYLYLSFPYLFFSFFLYTFSSSYSLPYFLYLIFSLTYPYLFTTCYLYTSCLSSGISILHLLYLLIAPKNAITSCTIQFVLGSASASLYFHILYLIYMFTLI
jgi:hypothetical protein